MPIEYATPPSVMQRQPLTQAPFRPHKRLLHAERAVAAEK